MRSHHLIHSKRNWEQQFLFPLPALGRRWSCPYFSCDVGITHYIAVISAVSGRFTSYEMHSLQRLTHSLFLGPSFLWWLLVSLWSCLPSPQKTTFFFFCLFRATPTAHGGSQARGRIGAVATSLCHSHSNAGSQPCLRPTQQLTATPHP